MSPETGPALTSLALIALVAAVVHLLVRGLKALSDRILAPAVRSDRASAASRRHPKIATIVSLLVSTAIFVLWFGAVGLAMRELQVDLTAYLATATIIGLAVGFGSQGLVQDVVIGLTMIFSNALDIGDTVEVSGQVGRVDRMGLRFTTLTNFVGQTVFIPNRNIGVVGRFRRGAVRVYVDVQVPADTDAHTLAGELGALAAAFRSQHAAILGEPQVLGVRSTGPDGWRYVRLMLRVWPGQQVPMEHIFRQRVLALLRSRDDTYADWMVSVSHRVAEPRPTPEETR
jgi:moderate conductance mechanosensitive channel